MPDPAAAFASLIAWFRAEYQRRTDAVESDAADLSWVVPEYRVSWTEVLAKAEELGIRESSVDLRLKVDEALRATKQRAPRSGP